MKSYLELLEWSINKEKDCQESFEINREHFEKFLIDEGSILFLDVVDTSVVE